jgi:hypothetical protein
MPVSVFHKKEFFNEKTPLEEKKSEAFYSSCFDKIFSL